MTKKEQVLAKELQRKNMLIEATKELVSLQRQRIEEVTKLLAKQKKLTDKLIEVNIEAFDAGFTAANGSYLVEKAGGYTKMADHLIMGGPMMGFALKDDNIPVVKATNCTLFISTTVLNESNSAFSRQPTLPCIRCGKCMEACPVNLLPQQMYWHIRAKDFERTESHNLKDCIECGACSFVCPSHIPLVDYYRFAKAEMRDQADAQKKADLARQRHEFLEFRKERDKREREEKRAAHKAALQKKKEIAAKAKAEGATANDAKTINSTQKDDSKADAIKAAMQRAKAKKLERAKEAAIGAKVEDINK